MILIFLPRMGRRVFRRSLQLIGAHQVVDVLQGARTCRLTAAGLTRIVPGLLVAAAPVRPRLPTPHAGTDWVA